MKDFKRILLSIVLLTISLSYDLSSSDNVNAKQLPSDIVLSDQDDDSDVELDDAVLFTLLREAIRDVNDEEVASLIEDNPNAIARVNANHGDLIFTNALATINALSFNYDANASDENFHDFQAGLRIGHMLDDAGFRDTNERTLADVLGY